MKFYIFGSCSGTEPFKGRHHTAWALELNGRIYWFDAGETCSYTAHLMGVELLAVSDIFISHPHMDHVGGLGNLLWNIRKISNVRNRLPYFGDITVYIPNMETFNATLSILRNTEGHYESDYKTIAKQITDTILLNNNDIEVRAKHNYHIQKTKKGWESFSFFIKAQDKKIIYSGDVSGLEDLSDFLTEGCDILFMETGHHRAENICQKIIDNNYSIKSLYFLHHGVNILQDFECSLNRCRNIFPNVYFCNDKDIFEL